MLAGQIEYLASAVAVGDFAPTDQHREVYDLLRLRLDRSRAALRAILETDLAAFNRLLSESGLGSVIARVR